MKQTHKIQLTILVVAITMFFIANKSISQVTDRDGNIYKTVIIGKQEWMAENLNVEHFRNWEVIPALADAFAFSSAWCYYNGKPEAGIKYGKLYNWYAVNDPRGLAPEGWRIPTDADWNKLCDFLGSGKVAGGKMKATILWDNPNTGATNSSGFTGLPGGLFTLQRECCCIGEAGFFWSSTEVDAKTAWYYHLEYNDPFVYRDCHFEKGYGMSVRCVRD